MILQQKFYYMTKGLHFLYNRTKDFLFHKLLPGTRWKLVKEKIFGSIIEKMQTFGHIIDYK